MYELFGERLLHFAFAIIHNREQAEENAMPLLNGPDKNDTPLWWDVK